MADGLSSARVGDCDVDFQGLTIQGPEGETAVEPKVMSTLRMLVERAGETVTRNELIDQVWGVEFGADESLSRAISLIRKALGDTGKQRRYIRTVPRSGYRLVAPVVSPSPKNQDPGSGSWYSSTRLVVGGLVLFGAALLMVFWGSSEKPQEEKTVSGAEEVILLPRLAVLPLTPFSSDSDIAYVARGVTEDITQQIGQRGGVQVISRASSFSAAKRHQDVRAIARELGASHILQGSLDIGESVFRINVQLVSGADGVEVWSEKFTASLKQLIEIQEQIAAVVAGRLQTRQLASVSTPRPYAASVEAYDLFLRGKFARHEQRLAGENGAVALFSKAVELEPEWGRARAMLANAYQAWALHTPPHQEARGQRVRLAVEMARSALALDANDGTALAVLAAVRIMAWDWIEGRILVERAMAASPSETSAADLYLALIHTSGDIRGALEVAFKRLEWDPNNTFAHNHIAWASHQLGDFEQCAKHAKIAYELGDALTRGPRFAPICLAALGEKDEALAFVAILSSASGAPQEEETAQAPSPYYALIADYDDANVRSRFVEWVSNLGFPRDQQYLNVLRQLGAQDVVDQILFRNFGGQYGFTNPYEMMIVLAPGKSEFRQSDAFQRRIMETNLPDYWREYGWPDVCRPGDDLSFSCE